MPGWEPDVLDGFLRTTLTLADPRPGPSEQVDEIVATLVAPAERGRFPAALVYVHGWNDYFFQRHLADWAAGVGVGFTAVDLRRYGRSLRPGHLCGYIDDFRAYADEIGQAVAEARSSGAQLVGLWGHSTGGLASVIAAAETGDDVDALVLNAPWLTQARQIQRQLIGVFSEWGRLEPAVPLRADPGPGVYGRSISAAWEGEWAYDAAWKSSSQFRHRMGWLRAVHAAQTRIADGLRVGAPVVCLTSRDSDLSGEWGESAFATDTVLDVHTVRERAVNLADDVTSVQIPGGMHDLALSREEPRRHYLRAIEEWLRGRGWI